MGSTVKAADGTLHERIVADIEAQILSGAWPPGSRVPTEQELAAHYGCARLTVHKAMAQVARAGLVERRRRAGTVVARLRSQGAVLQITDIETEVEGLGARYGFRLLEREELLGLPDGWTWPDLPVGARVLALRVLHTADGAPFCLEERLVNLDAIPAAADAPFAEIAPSAWLLREVPWTTAEHRIRAVAAGEPMAAILGLDPGEPVLQVERTTWRQEQTVTTVRLSYPATLHTLVARFTPSGG